MPAPLIAVPTAHLEAGKIEDWRPGGFAVADTYISALRRAGARPVLLTAPEPAPAEEVLASFDGVLLTGGGDFQPRSYGSVRQHPKVFDVQDERDMLELDIVRAAVRLGLPLLGICRGLQAINIAFGGTLHQHLPELDGAIPHGEPNGGGPVLHHLRVDVGSMLGRISGGSQVSGMARHHQGIDTLGDGLVATAWTEDGLIEGIERHAGWMVAVQWHPEVTAGSDASQQGLFDALVKQAGRRAITRVA